MTRRIVVFTDPETGVTYKTPEFNGDRSEQQKFKLTVNCRSNWSQIFAEFAVVSTLDEFKAASKRAQEHWEPYRIAHNYFEAEIHPVEEITEHPALDCLKLNSMGKAFCIPSYPSGE